MLSVSDLEAPRITHRDEIDQMPWAGREAQTREICLAIMRAPSFLPVTDSLLRAATHALAGVELAAGHYGAALELLQALDDDPRCDEEPASLADMVEAGIRGGDRTFAVQALHQLEARVRMQPTPWGSGVLTRSRALAAADADAERLYLEATAYLTESGAVADVARSHLLFGEWLRRRRRRAEARAHLRAAHDLFVDIGARCFAERARVELAATGERARTRTVETQDCLTPQEHHIAQLAAEHATNREIGRQLFISARTVEYHLHHVFRKLEISSRRELSTALASRG